MAREVYETANILVALGGDLGNTVPKYNVTAGEIAVLQVIHGGDAILDIEPSGVVKRTPRVERARLDFEYSSDSKKKQKTCPVEALYPGAAARIFQRLDELRLASVQFKPGLAPEGIDDREEDELKAIQEGVLLSDGTIDEDAFEDLEAEDKAEEQADEPADEPAPKPAVSAAVASAERRAERNARYKANAQAKAAAVEDASALS